MKQKNIVSVTHELLAEFLKCAEDTKVVRIFIDPIDEYSETVQIVVEGPRCNVVPKGAPIAIMGFEQEWVLTGEGDH